MSGHSYANSILVHISVFGVPFRTYRAVSCCQPQQEPVLGGFLLDLLKNTHFKADTRDVDLSILENDMYLEFPLNFIRKNMVQYNFKSLTGRK